MRRPGQGVANIVRFNWHFYVLAGLSVAVLAVAGRLAGGLAGGVAWVAAIGILLLAGVSLLVSWYVYDLSGLYLLDWLNQAAPRRILNIHAGFDEASVLLQAKFPAAALTVLDFYDPEVHTEVSIRRARRACPPFAGTRAVRTSDLPVESGTEDCIVLMMAAHEIRDASERAVFFAELNRILTPAGTIYLTEHLRDGRNLLAYNVGFLHFLSRQAWYDTFRRAGLSVAGEVRHTPFVTTFLLGKNGDAS